MTMIIANAPCSFGAFELSDPEFVRPDPDWLLRELAGIGYQGIDLGDPGYLGSGPALRERLVAHGMGLAGGWIQLPFFDDDAYAASLPVLAEALALFTAAGTVRDLPSPRPTLAVSSRPIRVAHPGGGASMPELALSAGQWKSMGRNVDDAVARCAEAGFEATFHHHACTDVESPDEVDRLLEVSSVGLTLDTGHLIVGGGDPIDGLRRWGSRINHLHLKDARAQVIADALAGGANQAQVWDSKVFCPFGAGDLQLAEMAAALREADYSGWLVVEQDVVLHADETAEQAMADQRTNYQVLAGLGLV